MSLTVSVTQSKQREDGLGLALFVEAATRENPYLKDFR
jgi:hypothetical protein